MPKRKQKPEREAPRKQRGDARLRAGAGILVAGASMAGLAALLHRAPRPRVVPPPPAPPSAGSEAARPGPSDAGELDAGADADAAAPAYVELDGGTLAERNEVLVTNLQNAFSLDEATVAKIRAVFTASDWIGQGNPKITRHPLTRAECLERRAQAPRLVPGDPRCGAPNMVPLYDPSAGEKPENAKACIDQYEFPNLVCEYPVVWVRANEAQTLCHALGKRLCDAHEWEGGCAGALKPPESEYSFDPRRIQMQYLHNKDREIVWSYGKEQNQPLCATGSRKSPKCVEPTWNGCGSNDYPAGSFPSCVSPLGAYDLNGNAAEHMNFPRKLAELGSRGGSGETEMKGSWFIFSSWPAHEDDCRWRAPDWHVSPIDDPNSHRNYHLGFRCCKDLKDAQDSR